MRLQSLQVDTQVIQADELLPLLQRYQLMTQVRRGLVIDRTIADIPSTAAERQAALETFCQQQQLTSPEAQSAWLQNQSMTLEELEELAIRPMLLEKFKTATWGHRVESYFLKRKTSLDQAIYSLIRSKDKELIQELYFRIQEGEQSFGELARQYSQGLEAHTGGIVGPVPLSQIHPVIAKILSTSQPAQLWSPIYLEGWFVIIRLEKLFPAQLDQPMRDRLLDELFETWISEEIEPTLPLTQQIYIESP